MIGFKRFNRRCFVVVIHWSVPPLSVSFSAAASNTSAAQDQQEYTARYNGYVERYEKAKERYDELSAECEAKKAKGRAIERFLADFAERDEPITEFDDCLWLTAIDRVIVRNDGVLVFRFNYGGEIKGRKAMRKISGCQLRHPFFLCYN